MNIAGTSPNTVYTLQTNTLTLQDILLSQNVVYAGTLYVISLMKEWRNNVTSRLIEMFEDERLVEKIKR
jgi:hypothetical protein